MLLRLWFCLFRAILKFVVLCFLEVIVSQWWDGSVFIILWVELGCSSISVGWVRWQKSDPSSTAARPINTVFAQWGELDTLCGMKIPIPIAKITHQFYVNWWHPAWRFLWGNICNILWLLLFTARCYAKRGIATASCQSVRLSVCRVTWRTSGCVLLFGFLLLIRLWAKLPQYRCISFILSPTIS